MSAAVLREAGARLEVEQIPVPRPRRGEVLVRVAACGVCTSELDMWRGLAGHARYPWYAGHEVSGTVEAAGDRVGSFAPGDRVAVWVTERGYAEYVAVPAEHCFPASGVAPELALGEPLACAVNIVQLADVALGDDVVIVGAGFMGLLVLELVQQRGPRHLIVADTRQDALERARKLGASHVVDVTNESLPDVVEELTGNGADVTFEMTGVEAALRSVGTVTRMSGTVVIGGYHQGEPRAIPLGEWNWMAFRIANAHFRDVTTILRGMERGMRLLTSGRISLEGLVTHRFGLDRIDEAFATAVERPDGFVKATVVP
jgi:2-desacetyl-2-hydroxyethyl bacteriochlorophyllide A dehydrogenase